MPTLSNRPLTDAGRDCEALRPLATLRLGRLHHAETVNRAILQRYLQLRDHPATRRTHQFEGRFENTYIELAQIPELQPVVDAALHYAHAILDRDRLKYGFWFNEMGPGERTTLHSHEEADELLSCVYYVTAPAHSGRLEVHDDPALTYLEPRPGLFAFFDPSLPHAVETNRSADLRLSVAFNFGPADTA